MEQKSPQAYDFSKPSNVFELPEELKEVSGIVYLEDELLACVQDEVGAIYYYNLKSEKITDKQGFAIEGDYEDIAKKGDVYYILKSNGTIYEKTDLEIKKFPTDLNENDNTEGLCFDAAADRLLVGCKNNKGDSETKRIYSFSLSDYKLSSQPVIKFKESKHFRITALAIHPINKELYVLSSNAVIIILDNTGKIKGKYNLDAMLFQQPEGISFATNGDLYISNEAKSSNATIVKYNFLKK
ncbi:MAG TPA: SdiA-regulated domain-containing protein [Cytophagaceae bacterium]